MNRFTVAVGFVVFLVALMLVAFFLGSAPLILISFCGMYPAMFALGFAFKPIKISIHMDKPPNEPAIPDPNIIQPRQSRVRRSS